MKNNEFLEYLKKKYDVDFIEDILNDVQKELPRNGFAFVESIRKLQEANESMHNDAKQEEKNI
ncbi:hypothetical protein [Aliarcobacter cryaerophilus]|uniref:hypothetical protein n=1 Tax=Aliarcobacter cryaerophilus TaxID=28198 RepID=UPI003DA2A360